MMKPKEPEDMIFNDNLYLSYRFDAGRYGSRFYAELRNKRIWGTRCPGCGRVTAPPQSYCGRCHGVEANEWIEQGDEGILEFFDVHYYPFVHPRTGKLQEVPWADGVIRLDGGARFWHYVVPAEPEKLESGARYKAVWREEGRTGSVHDILHFRKMEADETSHRIEPKVVAGPPLVEPVSTPGLLAAPYRKSVGKVASRFFAELRDNAVCKATRCRSCNRVYMPPTSVCSKCFSRIDEWVELNGAGTVRSYTVVHYTEPAQPYPPPLTYAIIDLDGADTGMVHMLGEVEEDQIEIGMRVEPVFRLNREGNMLDIKYFRPMPGA